MNPCRFLLPILLVALAAPLSGAEPDPVLDPELPCQATRANPVTYDVDFSVVVTPPYKTKRLQVWLPIPPSDAGQEMSDGRLSTFPLQIDPQLGTEEVFGNRFAYFEFHEPQGAQIIRHRFKIKVWELHWQLEPARIQTVAEWPESFDRYRQGDSQSVKIDDRFRRQLDEIVPQRGNSLTDLGKVMTWVDAHFSYDHVDASLQASSEHALTKRHGHCSDYHGYCAAMGRVLGCPTRVAYGINTFPKNSPSHCKLEAFLPPYGWVSFDVSETQRMCADIRQRSELSDTDKGRLADAAQQRLLSGFRDNTWFVQTRGTDYDLTPKASQRVPVVRTIYAEADGQPLPEPDPAIPKQRAFSWMTVHQYTPDHAVTYPFSDLKSLEVTPPKLEETTP